MEEPIRKDDIIDFDGTKKGLQDLISALEKVVKILGKDLKASAEAAAEAIGKLNMANVEDQKKMALMNENIELLAAQKRELTKIEKESVNLKGRLVAMESDEAREVQKLKVAIENKKKAQKDAAREDDSAASSINKMRAKLKELTAEYNALDKASREKVAPSIKKLSDELKKAEGAIGNNTRSVGGYKTAIMGAAKQMFAFISPIALATVALNGLKNAFAGMEQGTKFLDRTKEQLKTFFQAIAAGNLKYAFSNQLPKDVKAAADLMDEIRKGDRKDLIEIAKLETDINVLRYKAADATLSQAEQLRYLNQAQAKENELITYKIADKREELKGVQDLLKTRKDDTDLLNKQAQIEADIINIQGDRNLRLESRSSAIREKQIKDALKKQEVDKENARLQMIGASMIDIEAAKVNNLNETYIDLGKTKHDQLVQNIDFYEKQNKLIEEAQQKEKQSSEDTANFRSQVWNDSLQAIATSLTTFGDIFEAQKQRELSAVGDNAKAREDIERKYAKRQQTISIGEALINGAMAITEIWRKYAAAPAIAAIFTALAAAQTVAQVAIIREQKFAKGGSGVLFGPSHSSGGVNVGIGEAEGGEHIAITSRSMTSKYGPKMLSAVSNSINQGKFFEVWSNVNKELEKSDPYTKKIYEVLSKNPVVYLDSDGNTVLRWPTGYTRIVKKRKN